MNLVDKLVRDARDQAWKPIWHGSTHPLDIHRASYKMHLDLNGWFTQQAIEELWDKLFKLLDE